MQLRDFGSTKLEPSVPGIVRGGCIEASKMVTERLHFLAGLQALLFETDSRRSLKERGQLHHLLANETWIFGEEFRLTSSDENLNTVLKKHAGTCRGPFTPVSTVET